MLGSFQHGLNITSSPFTAQSIITIPKVIPIQRAEVRPVAFVSLVKFSTIGSQELDGTVSISPVIPILTPVTLSPKTNTTAGKPNGKTKEKFAATGQPLSTIRAK